MSYHGHSKEITVQEEAANVLTHAVGAFLFLAGTVALLIKAYHSYDNASIISAWIYSISLVLLYSASTLYHLVTEAPMKKIMKMLDHCAIFLLIAGTYTPFLMVSFRNEINSSFLIIMWAIAAVGILYKIFMIRKYRLLSTFIYLAMGWMALAKIHVFYSILPAAATVWVLTGGLFYTVGTIFYSKESIKYNHALWHVFVLCGSICHFIAIYFYVY